MGFDAGGDVANVDRFYRHQNVGALLLHSGYLLEGKTLRSKTGMARERKRRTAVGMNQLETSVQIMLESMFCKCTTRL